MPKTSLHNRISAAFDEIAEAFNNPKLQEGFLNGSKENEILNKIVKIFEKRYTVHSPRVLKRGMEINNNIAHVPPKVQKQVYEGINKAKENVQHSTTLKNRRIADKPKNLPDIYTMVFVFTKIQQLILARKNPAP